MRATAVLMARAPVLMGGMTGRLVVFPAPHVRDFGAGLKVFQKILSRQPAVLNIGNNRGRTVFDGDKVYSGLGRMMVMPPFLPQIYPQGGRLSWIRSLSTSG